MIKKAAKNKGFVIVELVVVVVVIAILSVMVYVAYTGIKDRAIAASLKSDLLNATQQISSYKLSDSNARYPVGLDCGANPPANTVCVKNSTGNSFTYIYNNDTAQKSFAISASNGNIAYRATNSSAPIPCPTNFIIVPGSSTYGTSDFCIMKYEAKYVNGVPTSQASGTPWVSITQADTIPTAASACPDCRLVSEAEWLTLAQNVAKVPTNWTGGSVGSGALYTGHNDSAPNNSLVADTNDSNGYANETNTGGNQRRTLTLSNGEVIWDLIGNVWEWTSGRATTGKPGISGESSVAWKEWSAVNLPGTLVPNPAPSFGVAAASGWSNANGIGGLLDNSSNNGLQAILRGGYYGDGTGAGLWWMQFADVYYSYSACGFRSTR
ncbi:MAG: prepilin-type N-terminal cleavage/methylation domain-containing protein [Candidatus Saccharibacteria bacterium]